MIELIISSKPTEKNCCFGKWFQHYKNFNFWQITGCVLAESSKIDIVGTNIHKLDPTDQSIYILHLRPVNYKIIWREEIIGSMIENSSIKSKVLFR